MSDFRLRFVPLGGIVGVTKNMYLYELYQNSQLTDILIVDCGVGFPKDEEPGVDLIIPDISYLRDKTDKIRAVLITHGHEDHHSALPYHYNDLGRPPIYASRLTASFIDAKFKDRTGAGISVNNIDYNKIYSFGNFKVDFIHVTHSIPDTVHMVISSPVGNFYHGADFKFDLTPPYEAPPDFYKITKAGKEGVLCLLSDCLGVEREGLTGSESTVGETFEDAMRRTKGKFIMTSFSSNIYRIRQCTDAALMLNRKIVFLGRSMRGATEIAKKLGYLSLPHGALLREQQISHTPPHQLCIIATGSQGQFNSALGKIANRQHRYVKIKKGDSVFFSSSPVPGNENEVYSVIEELFMQEANVIYSDTHKNLHVSGHGSQDDLKLLVRFTNPSYFIPIGGDIRHQHQYRNLAMSLGHDPKTVFNLMEGETLWFDKSGAQRGETITTRDLYIDAEGIGDVGRVVLSDRKALSLEGIVMVVLILDKLGHLAVRPKIISRGFVFELKEKQLLARLRVRIESILKPKHQRYERLDKLKIQVQKTVEDFINREKGRRPLVLVEIVQVQGGD